jgi:coenzyme F420-reducing hydrogenase delta subunit/ferredoxin
MSTSYEFEPKILLLLCGTESDAECTFKISSNFVVHKETSKARIKPETILKAFSDGIDGVMVLTCFERPGSDADRNTPIENRLEVIGSLLDNIGLDQRRLADLEIQTDDPEEFKSISHDFLEQIRRLGMNPRRNGSGTEVKIYKKPETELDLEDEGPRVKAMLAETVIQSRLMLLEGRITAIIGRKLESGHIVPAVFETQEDLDELEMVPAYNLAEIVRRLQKASPGRKLGAVVYPCDERALNDLARRGKVSFENLELIKVTCTEAQGVGCKCEMSYPGSLELEERIDALLNKSMTDRFDFWSYQFSKCIKCYGCRDICPVCACELCMLEDSNWVKPGRIPPELSFHLIRYYHMADKCIGCGECEASCPVEIPLTTLHHQMIRDIRELFSYEAGFAQLTGSPLSGKSDGSSTCGGDE